MTKSRQYDYAIAIVSVLCLAAFVLLVYDIVTGGEEGRRIAALPEGVPPKAEALPYEPLGKGNLLIVDDPSQFLQEVDLETSLEKQTFFSDESWHFATTVQKGKSLDINVEVKRRDIYIESAVLCSVYRATYDRNLSKMYLFEVKVGVPANLLPWFTMPVEEGTTVYYVIGYGAPPVPKAIAVKDEEPKPTPKPAATAARGWYGQ